MGLQKYINQLLSDIAVATRNVPEPYSPADEEADEDFGLLPWMEDTENAPRKSLEEWSNLKKEQFPPENQLTDKQVSALLKAIKKMLDAYNCSAVFQLEVPERIQYRVIRGRFQQEVPMLKANYYFFEFCDQKDPIDTTDCMLGEAYCHCAFFNNFFGKYEEDEEAESEFFVDPYEEYMLKRRYGENWHKYIGLEDEWDYDDYELDDDFGLDDIDDDWDDSLPF